MNEEYEGTPTPLEEETQAQLEAAQARLSEVRAQIKRREVALRAAHARLAELTQLSHTRELDECEKEALAGAKEDVWAETDLLGGDRLEEVKYIRESNAPEWRDWIARVYGADAASAAQNGKQGLVKWTDREAYEKYKKVSSGIGLLRPSRLRTQKRAEYFLDLLSALVPKRIATEEIGDALELISKMVKARRPKWFVYLKVTTTFWWVAVHTLLHYAERVVGIAKAVTGKSDKDK